MNNEELLIDGKKDPIPCDAFFGTWTVIKIDIHNGFYRYWYKSSVTDTIVRANHTECSLKVGDVVCTSWTKVGQVLLTRDSSEGGAE